MSIGSSAEFAAFWLLTAFALALICRWGHERGFRFRNVATAVVGYTIVAACVLVIMVVEMVAL
jgi:hypothetical protein